MTPPAPTLHTFDPQIAGKVGLYIDPPPSAQQVLFYVGGVAPGGATTLIAQTYVHTGFDGLRAVLDASSTTYYWSAKVIDGTGTSPASAEVQAVPSAGPPPPLTAQQHIAAALGRTVNVGDQVTWSPAPAVVESVQADGSLA